MDVREIKRQISQRKENQNKLFALCYKDEGSILDLPIQQNSYDAKDIQLICEMLEGKL